MPAALPRAEADIRHTCSILNRSADSSAVVQAMFDRIAVIPRRQHSVAQNSIDAGRAGLEIPGGSNAPATEISPDTVFILDLGPGELTPTHQVVPGEGSVGPCGDAQPIPDEGVKRGQAVDGNLRGQVMLGMIRRSTVAGAIHLR
ncbi:MAG: hypothetical protein R6V26_10120 [Roseovarius sp.]